MSPPRPPAATDAAPPPVLATPWALPPEDVLRTLEVKADRGLSEAEVLRRRRLHGPNQLRQVSRRSTWAILYDQFRSWIVALLAAASAVSFAFGDLVEGQAIVAVILVNAAIGFVTERRALRSMEALRELGRTESNVRRDGVVRSVAAVDLVPGDVLILDAGDVLSADARILSGTRLLADESALTGESLPVDKGPATVPAEAALAERSPMLFKGTALTRGSAEAVVVATGMATELGTISALVEEASDEATPLEKRLEQLAHRLIGLTLAIALVVGLAFLASGRGMVLAIELGIALAVATFPEGLPIVATVALARGMWRMARRNALVEKLSAVETLGSTTIILTDKTGTLTENRMTVVELRLASGGYEVSGGGLETTGEFRREGEAVGATEQGDLVEALQVAVLCNNATLGSAAGAEPAVTGDPMEVALLVLGAKAGMVRDAVLVERPELHELSFDPDTQRMATLHQHDGRVFAAVKGAPERLIEDCPQVRTPDGARPLDAAGRARWTQAAEEMAGQGQRVLALAVGESASVEAFAFEDLVLLGLVGFFDPPRERVREAIDACQAAGIRVVMVTGDHGATGWTVAAAVGLIDPEPGEEPRFVDARSLTAVETMDEAAMATLREATVIARATPRQKLDLIALHQRHGEVVAMTGDGVNDAPALQKADIGIAMGRRGTQVAREAADMVLRDDEFSSIVAAVEQGRAIFANIRKFVVYLLSCNVSEIFAVGAGALATGPLPILPLQILFLNLVTDVFPALALGVCEGSPTLMAEPPRDPREPMLRRDHWLRIFLYGGIIAASVLGALAVSVLVLHAPSAQATTTAFLTLALAQLWHVFSMRNPGSKVWRNEVSTNPWVWGAVALCVGLLVLAVHWPLMAGVLSLEPPGWRGWGLAAGASLIPLVVGQLDLLRRAR